jgi:AcrR family transcriptional regulator
MATPSTDPHSLRTRKKLRTRELLVEAAAQLFAERGFDAVTVADVAHRAEVSEQTVYNYFASKEALVFDEEEAFTARFIALANDRPGVRLIDAVRNEVLAFVDSLIERAASPHPTGGMPYLIATSASVRRHWLAVSERQVHAMAHALVDRSDHTLSLPAAKVLATSALAAFFVVVDELGIAMQNGTELTERLKSLRGQIHDALAQLGKGFDAWSGGSIE